MVAFCQLSWNDDDDDADDDEVTCWLHSVDTIQYQKPWTPFPATALHLYSSLLQLVFRRTIRTRTLWQLSHCCLILQTHPGATLLPINVSVRLFLEVWCTQPLCFCPPCDRAVNGRWPKRKKKRRGTKWPMNFINQLSICLSMLWCHVLGSLTHTVCYFYFIPNITAKQNTRTCKHTRLKINRFLLL